MSPGRSREMTSASCREPSPFTSIPSAPHSLRNAAGGWAAPLLAHGAAATLGNVYEPYLALTPNLDIFTDRLRNGFNFAESAYASERVLSWMTTFVGDPLYRPFGLLQETVCGERRPAPRENMPPTAKARTPGIEPAAGRWRKSAWKPARVACTAASSGRASGLLQWSVPDKASAAPRPSRMAQKCYGKTEDGLRTVLHRIQILKAEGKPGVASALAGKELG